MSFSGMNLLLVDAEIFLTLLKVLLELGFRHFSVQAALLKLLTAFAWARVVALDIAHGYEHIKYLGTNQVRRLTYK